MKAIHVTISQPVEVVGKSQHVLRTGLRGCDFIGFTQRG